MGGLKQRLDDPAFPHVTYRRGSGGRPTPMLRGTGIRVQTLVVAERDWEMTATEIAEQYGLAEPQVDDALAFYRSHREEIDSALAEEERLARERAGG